MQLVLRVIALVLTGSLAVGACSSDHAASRHAPDRSSSTSTAPGAPRLTDCRPGDADELTRAVPGIAWLTSAEPLAGGVCRTRATSSDGRTKVQVSYAPTMTAAQRVAELVAPPLPPYRKVADLGRLDVPVPASGLRFATPGGGVGLLLRAAEPGDLVSATVSLPAGAPGVHDLRGLAAALLRWAMAQQPAARGPG